MDGKLETAMKALVSTLLLCGALSALAGPAVAGKVVSLHCQKGECTFSEELGPDQTHEYRGFCAEENALEFKMYCHPVKGMTCTPPTRIGYYWSCTCTNWDPTKRQYASIDLDCED